MKELYSKPLPNGTTLLICEDTNGDIITSLAKGDGAAREAKVLTTVTTGDKLSVENPYGDTKVINTDVLFGNYDTVLEQFKSDLNEWCFRETEDGKLLYQFEWGYDYSYGISSKSLERLLKEAKNSNQPFKDVVLQYLQENGYLDELDNTVDDLIQKFINEHADLDQADLDLWSILQEAFYNLVEIDYNVDELLTLSKPEELVIRFTDGLDVDNWLKGKTQSETILDWFLATQGFTRNNVLDKEKCTREPFLKQVWNECVAYDAPEYLMNHNLTAIPNSTNWDAISDIYLHGQGIIKAGTTFGFFQPFNGSGSGFEIKTIKDIVLTGDNEKEFPFKLTVTTHHDRFDYSPDVVYGGLVRPDQEQLEPFSTTKN